MLSRCSLNVLEYIVDSDSPAACKAMLTAADVWALHVFEDGCDKQHGKRCHLNENTEETRVAVRLLQPGEVARDQDTTRQQVRLTIVKVVRSPVRRKYGRYAGSSAADELADAFFREPPPPPPPPGQ